MSQLAEYLTYQFVVNALIGGSIVAIACGAIGVPLVLRRLSLLSDGLAHIAFAGIAIAVILRIPALYTVLLLLIVGSYVVYYLINHNTNGDAAIALLLALGTGSGILIISFSNDANNDIVTTLFGNILSIRSSDIVVAIIAVSVIVIYYLVFHSHILLLSFNHTYALVTKSKCRIADIIFIGLVAVTVTLTTHIIGILLSSALIAIPALISLELSKSFKGAIVISVICAVLAVQIGFFTSLVVDIPTSPAVALLLACTAICIKLYKAMVRHGTHRKG